MTDTSQQRAEELFAAALSLAPDERERFLRERSRGEPELAAEVASLIEHHERSPGFLEQPLARLPPRAASPARIGRYRVLGLLGEGGMGVVYRAEQDGTLREVALKVIRPGLASAATLRRFEQEARVLARLEHPGIAQVFDAGTADFGAGAQPFFAMELVRGESLAHFARSRALGTRERIALLAQVADALDHAHRRGVVHRDMKPSNVLVEEVDGRPRVRVLDFGVARWIDDEGVTTSLRTDVGQIVGTLAYMSPEQAASDSSAIGPRSDVYALGIVGYELLCERLPYDVSGRSLPDALRIVREDEPTPISRVVPALRGDVETILTKAIEKEPARRYASAGDFAADLRRYLGDEPIVARRPSRAYVIAKFARRHRALVAGAAAVFVALAIGLIATTRQSFVAAAERERADRSARRALAVANFQRDMLSRVTPERDGRDVKLLDVLDAAVASLPGELAGDPAAEAGVRTTLGNSYVALGQFQAAERELRRALELCNAAYGADEVETYAAQRDLGEALGGLSRNDEAEAMTRSAYSGLERLAGRDDLRTQRASLSLVYFDSARQRFDEAEARLNEELARRLRTFGERSEPYASALHAQADLAWERGQLEEAERLFARVLDLSIEVRGETATSTLKAFSMLGTVMRRRGELARAEQHYRRAVELGRTRLGADHPSTWTWMNNLAGVLQEEKHFGEAEGLLTEVMEQRLVALGEEHEDTLISMNNLALLYSTLGRYGEAQELHARTLAIKQRVLGPDHRSTLTSLHNLGLNILLLGDDAAALPYFREAAERSHAAWPEDHWQIAAFLESYGACLCRLKRYDEAQPVLLDALARMQRVFPLAHARVRSIAERLYDLYVARGDAVCAAELKAEYANSK